MCLIGIYILYLSVNNKYEMRPIFLIGYMGSGKTTLGRALGRRLGLQFIDLDLYIESRYMRTISQLFAERGEDKFRSIEREMLHEVAEMEDVVVACQVFAKNFVDGSAHIGVKVHRVDKVYVGVLLGQVTDG